MNINIFMKTVTIENIVKNVDVCDIVISIVTIMKLYRVSIETNFKQQINVAHFLCVICTLVQFAFFFPQRRRVKTNKANQPGTGISVSP